MRIDHLIYATADLDAAAARLEAEYGLVARGGGRHEGIGTHNRIVPLANGYLELLAVADQSEADGSPLGSELAGAIRRRGEGLLGWVVAVSDAHAEAARIHAEISQIVRAGLTGTLAGVAAAMAEPFLPFFIERGAGSRDPSKGGDARGIEWVELSGDEARLRDWLGPEGADLPVRVQPGAPAILRAAIGDAILD